jgi:ADP-ribose pyrophosphatase
VRWDDYDPPHFTDAEVVQLSVHEVTADPLLVQRNFRSVLDGRLTFEQWGYGEDGLPRNPRGRKGLRGRGVLYRWGANLAADPIVTRFEPVTRRLQVPATLAQPREMTSLDRT